MDDDEISRSLLIIKSTAWGDTRKVRAYEALF